MEPEQLLPQRLAVLGENPTSLDQQLAHCFALPRILASFLLQIPLLLQIFHLFSPFSVIRTIIQLLRIFIIPFSIFKKEASCLKIN